MNVIASLTADAWAKLNFQLAPVKHSVVCVRLPRFTVETPKESEDLMGILRNAGAISMFTPEADFPDILNNESLQVSKVIQKAFIGVTEDGTEAAAATSSSMIIDPGDGKPLLFFVCDHPFVFLISDVETGIVYFIGNYQG